MENINECKHENRRKSGIRLLTGARKYQMYQCTDCGKVFRSEELL